MNFPRKAGEELTSSPAAYLAIALVSGAIIAYELFVMRVFANGGWAHFGSTVISIAMFGFGVFSTVLCLWKQVFKARLVFFTNLSLLLLGPAMVAANSAAQTLSFNPIFLVSDPDQKYHLALLFLIYFVPFLFGAGFIGLVFLAGQSNFGLVYFANMAGSGLGGLVLFAALYYLLPEKLFVIPVAIWAVGALLWYLGQGRSGLAVLLLAATALTVIAGGLAPQINVSTFKGVSYARNFPDAQKVYQSASPFGYVEVYSSSYFHFAPGLSDVASLYLKEMPEKAYLGMYMDGDGPIGIMKKLPDRQVEYFKFLPLSMPYLLKPDPEVLIMQFGGGISTNVALKMGARKVTVAEGNPMVIQAVRDSEVISEFTGRILDDPKVNLVPYDGRIYVNEAPGGFDVVDLSLADSTGLSMPGGSSIYEKYTYTRETLSSCLRALKRGGLLSITVWNKEDPPKSTLKLIGSLILAARAAAGRDVSRHLFLAHTYLSTLTILFKDGGFSDEEVRRLSDYCRKMSFEIIHQPGQAPVPDDLDRVFKAYRNAYFLPQENEGQEQDVNMTAGHLYRLAVSRLLSGDFKSVEDGYVFNVKPLTNDRPYFAGFVKPEDIPRFLDKLEVISDEWGYLLLGATLLLSMIFGCLLLLFPMIFGWKAFFSSHRGKTGIVVYFSCLGVGYMLVEIGLIAKYILCLGNPTVSVAVLIPGMLIFSGLGSYFSGRLADKAGRAMILICGAIAGLLLVYMLGLDVVFRAVGLWPYSLRILVCLALLFPLAFLMGFPFALGMSKLSSLKKEPFFVWAWGINGSFSVVGSVLVPILSVLLGLSAVMIISAAVYLLALPAFFRLMTPDVGDPAS
ncbi:MAG: hypothetical protein AB1641_22955 [Thermodesulfobacteriota bacterium]